MSPKWRGTKVGGLIEVFYGPKIVKVQVRSLIEVSNEPRIVENPGKWSYRSALWTPNPGEPR